MVNAPTPERGAWVPLELETDPVERKRREDHAAKIVRQQRVERDGLEPCRVCGGTTEDVEDRSLRCVCAEQDAERRARITRMAYEKRTDLPEENVSDRLAP